MFSIRLVPREDSCPRASLARPEEGDLLVESMNNCTSPPLWKTNERAIGRRCAICSGGER